MLRNTFKIHVDAIWTESQTNYKCSGILKMHVNAISMESQMLATAAHPSLMPTPSSTWRCHARAASVGCKPRECTVTCTVDKAGRVTRKQATAKDSPSDLRRNTRCDPSTTKQRNQMIPNMFPILNWAVWEQNLESHIACMRCSTRGRGRQLLCVSRIAIIQQSYNNPYNNSQVLRNYNTTTKGSFENQECPGGALASARRLSNTWLQCYARTASGSPRRSLECLWDSIRLCFKYHKSKAGFRLKCKQTFQTNKRKHASCRISSESQSNLDNIKKLWKAMKCNLNGISNESQMLRNPLNACKCSLNTISKSFRMLQNRLKHT